MQRDYPRRARWFRSVGVVAGIVLLCVIAVSCTGSKPKTVSVPPPRWAGITVTVASPDGPAKLIFQRHGSTWARQTGATLKIVAPNNAEFAVDLWVLNAAELPHFAAAGRLQSLDDREWTHLLPPYRLHLLRWENTAYALPLLGDSLFWVYRADLYGDAETKKAYEAMHRRPLTPPETWDDVADQAAFFAERRKKASLPPFPADDAGIDRHYFAVAASYAVRAVLEERNSTRKIDDAISSAVLSFQYDAATGEPRIAGPGFVAALKLLQSLQPHRSKQGDCIASLKSDEAVLGLVTLGELAGLRADGSEARWGVCRVPGHASDAKSPVNYVPCIGANAWLGAIAKNSDNAAAALDLLTMLSGNAVSLQIVHDPSYGCGPYRRSHLEERLEGWSNYGLSQEQTNRLVELLRESADPKIVNPAYVLRLPNQQAHQRVLIEAVRKVLTENGNAAEVMTGAAKRWQELDGNPAKARADYRRSLGLQP